ncbi:MAG: DinB family protein [Phycisphaerae bacterium]
MSNTGPAGAVAEQCCTRPEDCATIIAPLRGLMRELSALIGGLSDAQYCSTAPHQRGTIGGHVRHILDHVSTVVRPHEVGGLTYDARERGTDVETSRTVAQQTIHALLESLNKLNSRSGGDAFDLAVQLTRDGAGTLVRTTFARELAFVQSHTVHHNAIIAAIARALGATVPEDFGYAPATLAHEDRTTCAPSPSSH